ncbi:protein Z, vitamin K-dependent plasma glycoprotein a [Acipenser oxyrinchus oxyrinchus]|uniref:Protein Z, vitamin K-dependent plasma glycoprotein a n=1 Tax=Acipenser oxyrinchus oxyrinchus TaxID=40147 RepID=A0AAD8G099_ACIOX|nr:protein Z, vitamin K-dependent plasma glycoprotein a [Acipenser oxyrinchus oxyrinchus]
MVSVTLTGALWTIFLLICSINEAEQKVFLAKENADEILGRHKRANSRGEEMLTGNIERECIEEVCNYEEAREVFKDTYNTDVFWSMYIDGDQCSPNPCLNGGVCADSVGRYDCICKAGFSGGRCETDNTQCLGNCNQFCKPGYKSYACFCAEGYELEKRDRNKCKAVVDFPCGKAKKPSSWNPVSPLCTEEECPWQVELKNEESKTFCNGVILSNKAVLTTASCASKFANFRVFVGKQQKQVLYIKTINLHPRYRKNSYENDLAVVKLREEITFKKAVVPPCLPEKDFAENVLMKAGQKAKASSWQKDGDTFSELLLNIQGLNYEPLDWCQQKHNFTITSKMFCVQADNENGLCKSSPGSPLITSHKDFSYLTGILIAAPSEYNCRNGYVYFKISRYLSWLKPLLRGA